MTQFGYMPDTHGGPYDQPEPGPEQSANFAAQLLSEAEKAEGAGFDGVFVPERHARTECMFPSPLPLLAAIAARTQRVKIGTDILMPPLYNPVDLAQSTALIDVLSRGRLILGVGYHPRYFAHFGVPIKQREGRFEESLEILKKAWTTPGPFAHHGKYYDYEAIHLTPKPYQRPGPPIWIGAFGPKSIARAGRLADAWTMAPFFDRIEDIKAQVSIYRDAAAKAGRAPHIALLRDGWLANTREEAEQTFGKLWLEECKFTLNGECWRRPPNSARRPILPSIRFAPIVIRSCATPPIGWRRLIIGTGRSAASTGSFSAFGCPSGHPRNKCWNVSSASAKRCCRSLESRRVS
jgi:alkanesulfonate monooxygenase SsuD/methylene tetrahydromethanopterin reductase-like flavin-dependent oxidoreductase (luciferase family)